MVGVVDNRLVKIVKSHWPERQGWCPVKVNRIILLVRNPFDAIDSYFNMCLTNTHHLSLSENVYEQFRYKDYLLLLFSKTYIVVCFFIPFLLKKI